MKAHKEFIIDHIFPYTEASSRGKENESAFITGTGYNNYYFWSDSIIGIDSNYYLTAANSGWWVKCDYEVDKLGAACYVPIVQSTSLSADTVVGLSSSSLYSVSGDTSMVSLSGNYITITEGIWQVEVGTYLTSLSTTTNESARLGFAKSSGSGIIKTVAYGGAVSNATAAYYINPVTCAIVDATAGSVTLYMFVDSAEGSSYLSYSSNVRATIVMTRIGV